MTDKQRKALDKAVRRFLDHLFGDKWPQEATLEYEKIERLVFEAFKIYCSAWSRDSDPGAWTWPLDELDDPRPFWHGLEPWTVLLREAVYLSRRYMLNLPLEAMPHEDQDA